MDRVLIRDIGCHANQEIEIWGWLYNLRSKGKIHFLQIRDGTGRIQAVAVKGECDETSFETIGSLKMEASLTVRGTAREDRRAPSGYELLVQSVHIIQNPDDDYPLAKKAHGIDFLLENRHLWLRSAGPGALLAIRDTIVRTLRGFFKARDFVLIDTPVLTGSIGESASSLFSVDYFDLGNAYLAQTGQLYLEAACMAFGSVYNFGPTFRAEKSKTRRHLTEFWMLEAEVAFSENADNMKLQEDLIVNLVEEVLSCNAAQLKDLGRDIEPLKKVSPPFPRIEYTEAVDMLHRIDKDITWGKDLGGDEETAITEQFDKPLFITNYPRQAKAFYMKENPANADTVLCSDLLAPEGYGEIIGGSQREDDYGKLLSRIREEKLPEESYAWYLDLRRYGSVPHSGFGLGLERTIAWITGIRHIREAIPFPRTISRIYP